MKQTSFDGSVDKKDRRGPHIVRHIIYGQTKYPHSKPIRYIESELTSNLALQKLLYYNFYFSITYFYIMFCTQIFKLFVMIVDISTLLRFIFILTWGVLEIFRLLNGFEGNIKEQFPELFSFFLISVLNFALQIFKIALPRYFPIEYSLVILMSIFYGLELILSMVVMLSVNRAKVALLGRRAPPDNDEQLIKKGIERMRNEQYLNKQNKDEDALDEDY